MILERTLGVFYNQRFKVLQAMYQDREESVEVPSINKAVFAYRDEGKVQ